MYKQLNSAYSSNFNTLELLIFLVAVAECKAVRFLFLFVWFFLTISEVWSHK